MAIEDALLASPIPADPNDPEFDAVRADLGRLFIRHKLTSASAAGRTRPSSPTRIDSRVR
jgi:hypothetical protein